MTFCEYIEQYKPNLSGLAKVMGVSRQAIHEWRKNNRVPKARLYQLNEILYPLKIKN